MSGGWLSPKGYPLGPTVEEAKDDAELDRDEYSLDVPSLRSSSPSFWEVPCCPPPIIWRSNCLLASGTVSAGVVLSVVQPNCRRKGTAIHDDATIVCWGSMAPPMSFLQLSLSDTEMIKFRNDVVALS